MWLATKLGFFSIVAKDEGKFFIRARVEQDLLNLEQATGISLGPVERWDAADYRYRLIVEADGLEVVMAALFRSIDYPNFKGEIAKRSDQRGKLPAYHDIWATMARLQK